MTSIIFILTFLISNSLVAQTKSQNALTTSLKNRTFSATLKEGYHFNDKAPNSVTTSLKKLAQEIVPAKLAARQIKFQLPKEFESASAALYVCDDAITYCETHHLSLKGPLQKNTGSTELKKNGPIDKAGFIEGDLQKALKLAKLKNQLVLIDFSARWCPGCVRYEKEVFTDPRFKKLTKNIVKLKIDVDQFQNFSLSEKYKISGIPAFVVINAKEEEVGRLLDFQTIAFLSNFFKTLQSDPTTDLERGQRLYAGGKFTESISYLEKVTPPPPELIGARVISAQENFNKDANTKAFYTDVLRKALKQETDSTRSLTWRAELLRLIDSKSPEGKTLTEEGLKLAADLLNNPDALKAAIKNDMLGEFTGFEKLLVAQYKADLIEASQAPPESVLKAWKEAAQVGAEYKIPGSLTGPSLRYLLILSQAKLWPEAEAQAKKILKFDPSNTDIQRRRLKFLLAQNNFSEAQNLGEKLIPTAEGRLQFAIAESLAKAYIGLGKKESAKRLLTGYLARPEIQNEKMAGSKKSLEGLLSSLQ